MLKSLSYDVRKIIHVRDIAGTLIIILLVLTNAKYHTKYLHNTVDRLSHK
jgi:hypothetical protein